MSVDLRTSHVLLTGATGFVGQAVLERLLTDHPGVRVTAVIRSQGSVSGADRLTNLLRKPVFGPWRDRVGADEVARIVAASVDVIEVDLAELTEVPATVDVVIHGASTVSFDPPIDEAFSHNLGGARALYGALERAGNDAVVVHVSTAYVGGNRRGVALEGRLPHTVDWRVEEQAAQSARARVELESREPAVLGKLVAQARAQHGKAGPLAVADASEAARSAWVRSQLVEYGRVRGESLGWPDVYGFTKALSERAAEELWGARHRLSVLRPSIIESALVHPYPGWIDGYKVADPLIIAYGRGQLPDFPGFADSVLDVVPVDHVVNAIIAAAEHPPEAGDPAYYHVTSGSRNRLSVLEMYENVRAYFRANPMPHPQDGPITAATWTFVGGRSITRAVRNKERMLHVAETALKVVPARRTRELTGRIQRGRHDLEKLRTFTNLYEAYTQTELIFDDRNTRALLARMPEADRAARGFDIDDVDWADYLQAVHFPSITNLTKAYSARRSATEQARAERELPKRSDVLAVFDLEGTVVDSNIVQSYLWVRAYGLGAARWPFEVASLAASLPRYLRAERRDRAEFIRTFQRRYRGMPVAGVERAVASLAGGALRRRVNARALERIRAHREAGHRTVLVTGAIDLLTAPLQPYFDEIVAGRMHSTDGVLTGHLDRPPLVGEARAAWLSAYAAEHGADLAQSYGYGDSHADVGWLRLVGHAHAVNPDAELFREARVRRWKVDDWRMRRTDGARTP